MTKKCSNCRWWAADPELSEKIRYPIGACRGMNPNFRHGFWNVRDEIACPDWKPIEKEEA